MELYTKFGPNVVGNYSTSAFEIWHGMQAIIVLLLVNFKTRVVKKRMKACTYTEKTIENQAYNLF